jgi:hypothetical protein
MATALPPWWAGEGPRDDNRDGYLELNLSENLCGKLNQSCAVAIWQWRRAVSNIFVTMRPAAVVIWPN